MRKNGSVYSRKGMTVWVGLLLLALLVTACSSKTDSSSASTAPSSAAPAGTAPASAAPSKDSNEKINLSFFHRFTDGANKAYFDAVVQEFEKQNPNVTIKVDTAANDTYKQKIQVLLAGNSAPDIFFAWSGEYAAKFARGGQVLDLSPYLQKDAEWYNQMIKSQFGPYTFDGKAYAVPVFMDAKAFYYNEDIFKKLNLSVPKNWTEFIKALKVIKDSGMTPIAFGDQSNWAVGHYLTTLNQRMVAPEVLQQDYNAATGVFTDPGYIAALKKMQELSPYFSKDPNAVTDDAAISDFVNGKAAIYYNQFNQMQYIKPAKFNWSWFDFPALEDGKGDQKAITGSSQGFLISSKSKHPEVAMKFLEFMTSKSMAEKMTKETSLVSAVTGAVNSNTADAKQVGIAATIQQASGMANWLDTVLESHVVDTYLTNAQLLVGNQATPEDVMKAVQKTAKEISGK